jgi:hypothetical protein
VPIGRMQVSELLGVIVVALLLLAVLGPMLAWFVHWCRDPSSLPHYLVDWYLLAWPPEYR